MNNSKYILAIITNIALVNIFYVNLINAQFINVFNATKLYELKVGILNVSEFT